jgi:hypothetical protein
MATSASGGRLEPARARVRLARLALGGGGVALFGLVAVLARAHHPGHAKRPASALDPPARLLQVVRRDRLQAGLLAPAEAAPEVASAPS